TPFQSERRFVPRRKETVSGAGGAPPLRYHWLHLRRSGHLRSRSVGKEGRGDCSNASQNGLGRSSSWPRTRHALSSTTTSARSTFSSASCVRRRVLLPACWSRSTSRS